MCCFAKPIAKGSRSGDLQSGLPICNAKGEVRINSSKVLGFRKPTSF